ncbi:MAG TPA: menaquinone biosynthesis protein [Candidatus Acidoferrales bacterium]|nr:menaquinone biosynthesis protein [Candidatus Acidoferrales bacterium]
MAKLRISIVEYLNTAPLVWGFTNGPLAGRYDLAFTLPSQCAEALRRREADIAIIPAIEYQRIENLVVLPGMAVAAKQPVRSILVLSKKPIEMAKRIALDTSSRSSAALVRILAAEKWGIQPEFVDAAPDASKMLETADAALVIGDPALRLDPARLPYHVYDLGAEWWEMTGHPMVFAVWAGHKDRVTPAVAEDFRASCRYGRAHLEEIVAAESAARGFAADVVREYLTRHIVHELDARDYAGMELFLSYTEKKQCTPCF